MSPEETDLVRFEHDECENSEVIKELCDIIDELTFKLVTLSLQNG